MTGRAHTGKGGTAMVCEVLKFHLPIDGLVTDEPRMGVTIYREDVRDDI